MKILTGGLQDKTDRNLPEREDVGNERGKIIKLEDLSRRSKFASRRKRKQGNEWPRLS